MNQSEVNRLGKELHVEYMQITPDMAEKMLSHNTANRTLSDNTVDAYAADMQAGRWDEYAFNPIVFDVNGLLKDGQHRLTAVRKSGATVGMWIADLPTTAGDMYDRGRPRTTKNILELRGYDKALTSNDTIAAVRFLYTATLHVHKLSDAQIGEALDGLRPFCTNLMNIVKTGANPAVARKSYISAAVLAARIAGIPSQILTDFCKAVNTGIMTDPNDTPPIMIRNLLLESRGRNDSTFRSHAFNATQEAINDFVRRKKRIRQYPGTAGHYTEAAARELKAIAEGKA